MIDKNPLKIKNMFDELSKIYDLNNDIISFGLHKIIKKQALSMLNKENSSKILDVCSGSGDIVKLLSRKFPTSTIIGIDFSDKMLEIAKNKNPNIEFLLADCTNMPFSDNEFDKVTACFGLRNVEERQKALREINRILKKGGEFLHLDFGYHNFLIVLYDFILSILRIFFGKYRKHYKYLIISKNEYPEPDEIIKEIEKSGFSLKKKKTWLFGAICAQVFKKNFA